MSFLLQKKANFEACRLLICQSMFSSKKNQSHGPELNLPLSCAEFSINCGLGNYNNTEGEFPKEITEQCAVWLPHVDLYRPCLKHVLKRFLWRWCATEFSAAISRCFWCLESSDNLDKWLQFHSSIQFNDLHFAALPWNSTFVKNYVFW